MPAAVASSSLRGRAAAPAVGADAEEPPWETIRELYQVLRGLTREALAPHRLLLSEYQTLRLCEQGPAPLKEVTQALGVTPAATTDLVRRLAQRRLLSLSPHATDRRSRIATLTPKGRRLLSAARHAHSAALRELGVRLSPEAREGLRRGLSELREALVVAHDA